MSKNNQPTKNIATNKNSGKSELWRLADSLGNTVRRTYQWLDTGYPELNSLLETDKQRNEAADGEGDYKSGGWPLGTTTEVCVTEPGIGELRLFIPALRALIRKNAALPNVILINPPYVPYAPALKKAQIDPACLTVISTNNKTDVLWAAEQALSAKCCAAVLTWTGGHPLSQKEARRLQLAAEKSETLHALFRHQKYLEQSSPFRLRIGLAPQPQARLQVNIVKQPLSWGGQQCVLSLAPHYEHWQRMHVATLPVSRHFNQASSTHVKVLAKATQSKKVLAFPTKQLMLPKVS